MMPVRAVVVDTFEERRLLNCYKKAVISGITG
jgi:hypothetical protein